MSEEHTLPNQDSWVSKINFRRGSNVKIIYQTEAAECGLACIAMVCDYYSLGLDITTLRAKYPFSLRGARLKDLVEICTDLGMAARPIKFELEDIDHLKTPCVLHWGMDHFVVLTKVGKGVLHITDPSKGRRKVSLKDASSKVTGVALELEPGPKVKRNQSTPSISLRELTGSLKGVAGSISHVIALAVLLEALGLLAPQFMRLVVDNVLSSGDYGLLLFLGISFSLLLLVRTVVEALRAWVLLWLNTSFNIGWTANVFNHLLRLPAEYFAKRHVGDVISRFGAVNIIQQTLTTQFTVVVLDGLMAAITISVLFYYSAKLALITLGFALLYLALRATYYRYFREITHKNINLLALQEGTLIETVRSILTLRINNQAGSRSARYMNVTADAMNMSVAVQKFTLMFTLLGSLITGGQKIAVLWVGASLAIDGLLTVGMLMAFIVYADQFTTRFVSLADYYVQFKMLRLHGERLADIVLSPPESSTSSAASVEPISYDLEIKNVYFRYGFNSRYILKDLSLRVGSGEVVAITGPSGCGKSTIAKVVVGALEHQAGTVLIGGLDREAVGRSRFRDLVSCVMQEDHLFSGTLLENITFFEESPDMGRVDEVIELVNLANEIRQMPMGLHSLVGDMGSSLSGGQKQRLLLARALYRRPKILILDEATSHLDVRNERYISAIVRAQGITTLIVAHRPETIASADRIYAMDSDGRIMEQEHRKDGQ